MYPFRSIVHERKEGTLLRGSLPALLVFQPRGIGLDWGAQVLHIDRNPYYGGECASLNLTVRAMLSRRVGLRYAHCFKPQNLYKKFVKDEAPPKAFFDALGADRDYNVDLIPKFIMAGGER
jgi:RAB protein geranylgeranyltransferase component A